METPCGARVTGALSPALPSTCRREVQDYVPAQLYHTVAGSAWLGLLGQHRQQTQALSPHQARAQFLGKSLGLGGEDGAPYGRGGPGWRGRRHFFLRTEAFSALARLSTCRERTRF